VLEVVAAEQRALIEDRHADAPIDVLDRGAADQARPVDRLVGEHAQELEGVACLGVELPRERDLVEQRQVAIPGQACLPRVEELAGREVDHPHPGAVLTRRHAGHSPAGRDRAVVDLDDAVEVDRDRKRVGLVGGPGRGYLDPAHRDPVRLLVDEHAAGLGRARGVELVPQRRDHRRPGDQVA